MECHLCKINHNEIIYETKYWLVHLAPDQTYLGRCYVTLKRHCGDLAELKKEEMLDFLEIVKRLESAMKKAFNAIMFNWTCLMNNAYREKNPNPHVHWHFRPRYNHKIKFAGLEFEDKNFGEHYLSGTNRKISKEVKEKIIKEIKQNL